MTARNLHDHEMRPVAHTLEGPLKVVMGCKRCAHTEVIKPSKRIKKIPAGFNQETWARFLEAGDRRLASGIHQVAR